MYWGGGVRGSAHFILGNPKTKVGHARRQDPGGRFLSWFTTVMLYSNRYGNR